MADLGLGLRVGFQRPLSHHFLPELAEIFNDPGFGLIGTAAFLDRLIQQVSQPVESFQHVRSLRQAFFQTSSFLSRHRQFIIHEPFYLYIG